MAKPKGMREQRNQKSPGQRKPRRPHSLKWRGTRGVRPTCGHQLCSQPGGLAVLRVPLWSQQQLSCAQVWIQHPGPLSIHPCSQLGHHAMSGESSFTGPRFGGWGCWALRLLNAREWVAESDVVRLERVCGGWFLLGRLFLKTHQWEALTCLEQRAGMQDFCSVGSSSRPVATSPSSSPHFYWLQRNYCRTHDA